MCELYIIGYIVSGSYILGHNHVPYMKYLPGQRECMFLLLETIPLPTSWKDK